MKIDCVHFSLLFHPAADAYFILGQGLSQHDIPPRRLLRSAIALIVNIDFIVIPQEFENKYEDKMK